MKQKKSDIYDPLMDDKNFVDLMEAEYQQQKSIDDALEKQKIWNALEKKTNKSKNIKTWVPLAAVATLIITLVPGIFFKPTDDISRVKGSSQLITVSIENYLLKENGSISPLPAIVNAGDTIVFKTHLEAEGIIAFGYAKNDQDPAIRFITQRTAPGKLILLKREGRTFGYSVDTDDKTLQFCAIAAGSIETLLKSITDLPTVWKSLPANSCGSITIQ